MVSEYNYGVPLHYMLAANIVFFTPMYLFDNISYWFL